jgi:hypothetical protein
MNIATLINTHKTDLLVDTYDSVKTFVSDDILVLVDGHDWNDWGAHLPSYMNTKQGYVHHFNKAPYRNYTFGLQELYNKYPTSDWYCYCESDVLFASESFKFYLKQNPDVWMFGNDLRYSKKIKFPYLNKIIKEDIKETSYFLGCCLFFNRVFIEKLIELDFFNKFLDATKHMAKGWFPDCDDQGVYDIGENLYPTLALHYGGKLKQFAVWNQTFNHWAGEHFKEFPMRWKPEITWDDNFSEASILHPVKNNSDLRWFHKAKRKRRNAIKHI